MADCNEVIRLDPHSYQAYKLRAAAYQAKGEGNKAEADRLQAGRLYRPKYDTVAHKAIKLELEVKNKDYVANYELLDSIIDAARANIKVSRSYSEEEATQILRVIDAILLQQRFITADQALLCDALVPRKLTAKILAGFDPKQLRFKPKAGDMVHFSYSFANALLYASIGEAMGFPIHVVLAPGHAFVRWSLDKSSYINWETSTGSVVTNSEYAAWRHISDAAIENGVYAAELSPNEILASVYYELGLVWSGAWRGLESESREKGEVMRTRKAIDSLTQAIELNKKLYEAYFQRGKCWAALRDLDRSLADNSVAIHLDPAQPAAYFGRGLGYLARGRRRQERSMTSSERSRTSIR